MRRVLVLALSFTLLVAGACYGGDEDAEEAGVTEPSGFPQGQALIDTGDDSVLIDVEIADTAERRARGLMNRKSLDEDSGMIFVFFENTTSSFYMKDTLIPLSIAFFDVRNRVIDILDMDPCLEEPCTTYSASRPYFGALEVNRGAFDDWGVSRGDTITLIHPSE